jgi:hypothetical protein
MYPFPESPFTNEQTAAHFTDTFVQAVLLTVFEQFAQLPDSKGDMFNKLVGGDVISPRAIIHLILHTLVLRDFGHTRGVNSWTNTTHSADY